MTKLSNFPQINPNVAQELSLQRWSRTSVRRRVGEEGAFLQMKHEKCAHRRPFIRESRVCEKILNIYRPAASLSGADNLWNDVSREVG